MCQLIDAIGIPNADFKPILAAQLMSMEPTGSLPRRVAETHNDPQVRQALDDLLEMLKRWWSYVPWRFRPFAYAWIMAIEQALAVELAPQSMKILRGMMRRDVDHQADMLWHSSEALLEAWINYYPTYVNKLIVERAEIDPLLLLRPEARAQTRKALATAADTKKKQKQRSCKLSAKLYRYVQSKGGEVFWSAERMAKELSSRKGGRRRQPDKISEAADALILANVARWIKDPDPELKRLQIIENRMMLEAPSALQ